MRRGLDTESLAGQVAVVTGGASGIGFALAESCAMYGMQIVLADIEEEALRRAVSTLQRRGARVIGKQIDVSRPDEVRQLADEALGRGSEVRLVFNNAGVGLVRPFLETSLADWRWILDVNLLGVVHCMSAFLPGLSNQQADAWMVNTSSAAGLLSPMHLAAYNASKHAVIGLTETVQRELDAMEANVQLSVVAPELVRTNIHHASRNRREHYSSGPSDPDNVLAQRMESAMSAEEASNRVFDGLRRGDFLILTHPETGERMRRRLHDLVHGGVPDPERID